MKIQCVHGKQNRYIKTLVEYSFKRVTSEFNLVKNNFQKVLFRYIDIFKLYLEI